MSKKASVAKKKHTKGIRNRIKTDREWKTQKNLIKYTTGNLFIIKQFMTILICAKTYLFCVPFRCSTLDGNSWTLTKVEFNFSPGNTSLESLNGQKTVITTTIIIISKTLYRNSEFLLKFKCSVVTDSW